MTDLALENWQPRKCTRLLRKIPKNRSAYFLLCYMPWWPRWRRKTNHHG